MSDCVIRARIDATDKAKAHVLFEHMGLTMSEAIRVFIKQTIVQKGLPFVIKTPNTKTLAALQEVEDGKHLKKTSMDQLRKEWHKACAK